VANPEFKLMGKLAEEVRRGIIYPLGKTGFYNTDQYEGLLRQNGFLTDREADLIDHANAQVGRSKSDWDKIVANYAADLLRQKGQIVTAAALQQEKQALSIFIPRYEEAMPWFNWYESVEPFLRRQSQAPEEIAEIRGWIIAADKTSRGLTITEYYQDGKSTKIVAPSFKGDLNNRGPSHLFMLHSSHPGFLFDGETRASYTELWYILVENFLLSPPHHTDIQKAIEGFVAKQQAQNTA
jgi:hypothetical protein